MKQLFVAFSLVFLVSSCDDGDLIVTTFDFDDISLENCGEAGDYVFYKVNNQNLESLGLRLGTTDEIFLETQTRSYNLDGTTNFVNYRTYSDEVDANFFCSNITPSEPEITGDFSGMSGEAVLDITAVFDDNDNVPEVADLEIDTDSDGIPDYIDFDDDGDNVPTANELDTENADGDNDPLTNPLDTDSDGIPDYLDPDDDGDGIPTIEEDLNANLNPQDDVTDITVGPDYLNPAVSNSVTVDSYRPHSYFLNTGLTVTLNDLVLTNGTEELIRETLFLGEIINAFNATITITPEFIPE